MHIIKGQRNSPELNENREKVKKRVSCKNSLFT